MGTDKQQVPRVNRHPEMGHVTARSDQSRRPDIAPVLGRSAGEQDHQIAGSRPISTVTGKRCRHRFAPVLHPLFAHDITAQRCQAGLQGIAGFVEHAVCDSFGLGLDQRNGLSAQGL